MYDATFKLKQHIQVSNDMSVNFYQSRAFAFLSFLSMRTCNHAPPPTATHVCAGVHALDYERKGKNESVVHRHKHMYAAKLCMYVQKSKHKHMNANTRKTIHKRKHA